MAMRLFVALNIEEAIRQRIARFIEGVRNLAPEARWVGPESLHVTLKFIGEKADDDVQKIEQTLARANAESFDLNFHGYGFFPGAKAPRVFWIGCDGGPKLIRLANTIDESLAGLGIPREEHAFTAHLTLARGGRGSGSPRRRQGDRPNWIFEQLQEKLSALPAPEFGTVTAREFFLYQSQLSPGGPRYTKLANVTLH
jgi:RNA 2',3'-cyclic 3'-phosphodiesterase